MTPPVESKNRSDCPTRETLTGYSLGTLRPGQILSVATHVDGCARCLAALQELDESRDALVIELAEQPWTLYRSDPAEETPALAEHLRRLLAQPPECRVVSQPSRIPTTFAAPFKVGPYEVLQPLGEGGMATVFRARHVHLGKIVALKLLPPARLSDPSAVALFVQEMKAVGQLSHPNIVQAYDAGVEGIPYLAMELLEGMDLSRLVKAVGPLRTADACECIRQAARGLQHAFASGLVHRDVKPSNLLLTPQGDVKLLDLGLARLEVAQPWVGEQPGTAGPSGPVLGTLDYIAPEQLRNSAAVDIRADLYSLGCTLYFLLTGWPPFAAQGRTVLGKQRAHLHEPPPDVRKERPDVPPELATILDRLLAKDPALRFGTPDDLAQALDPFAREAHLTALFPPAPPPTSSRGVDMPPSPPASASSVSALTQPHSPQRIWLLCVIVFLGVLGLGVALSNWLPSPDGDADDRGGGTDTAGGAGRIESLEVEHYRPGEAGPLLLGLVGNRPEPRAVGDLFRVRARLGEQSYCYLLVIQPNGQEWVLDPVEGPPRARESLWFPPQGPLRVDAAGVYAFVLLAAAEPSQEYERWKSASVAWTERPPLAQGVWRFDGTKSFQLSGQSSPAVSVYLKQLCQFLAARPGVDAVQAVAFSVDAEAPPAKYRSSPE